MADVTKQPSVPFRAFRPGRSKSGCALLSVLIFGILTPQAAPAQQAVSAPSQPTSALTARGPAAAAATPAPGATETDDRYRIGPGDVLDVRVFNRPQLSRDAVRVDARGMIRMPLIESEILAGCKTEGELAQEVAARYLKYQKNPQVDVFVKEHNSQLVALIGAVGAPGRFHLQRRVRLLELLALAGGPTPRAGRTLQIVHAANSFNCGAPAGADSPPPPPADVPAAADAGDGIDSYDLGDTLRGEAAANPYVLPGDIISLPEAEQVFVLGNVLRPAAIPLTERLTISRAIATVGGLLPDTKRDRIRIVRQASGNTRRVELVVDLGAIDRQRAEDVVLQAGDIVEVPTSGGRRFLRTLTSILVPSLATLPVRAVP